MPSTITLSMMWLQAVFFLLVTWSAATFHNPPSACSSSTQPGGSWVFKVEGNVYPQGYYYATLDIGHRAYSLEIDTGSDLTWVHCDHPSRSAEASHHRLYKPRGNFVRRRDPICSSVGMPESHPHKAPQDRCTYKVEYADGSSSTGVLVKDRFGLPSRSGSIVRNELVFGCSNPEAASCANGVLGLGAGKPSILTQLHSMSHTRNVVAHCLSGRGGGYLFLGDDFDRDEDVVWRSMSTESQRYSLEAADLRYGSQLTNIKGLPVVFDCGSTYTYFDPRAYDIIVSLIQGGLDKNQLNDAPRDNEFPVCWKGRKAFKSVGDAASYFMPLTLTFRDAKNVRFQLPPESYLVVRKQHGDVCLGIFRDDNGAIGNSILIGDISMQDKLVIYDNEKRRIGWVTRPGCVAV